MDANDLVFAGATEQARLVAQGEVSSRDIVEATLARIETQDKRLNAFRVVLAEEALQQAVAADKRRTKGPRSKDRPGPLNGVPVAIKDDVDLAGQPTCWGTAAHGGPAAADSEVVARLRRSGAVLIGKTHVPEMTMSPATESITFGASRNPWDVTRTPGGSSGGSAAAVAAGLVPLALGSDGGGSIRGPSCWNGVFGIKPQRDRVPLAPHDGAWQGMSVNGPIARSVADAALFLDVTADGVPKGGFVGAAARDPGKLRIAVSTKSLPGIVVPLGSEERAAVERTATLLEGLGHEVVERDPDLAFDIATTAFARVLRGIAEDIDASMPHPERLEPRTRRVAAVGRRIPASQVRRAREREADQARRINTLFEEVDVLLQPACAEGPYVAGELGRWSATRWLAMVAMRYGYFPPFNVTGQPACSVPAGFDDDGLPIGVQLVARPREEATLLSLAAQIEAARPWAQRRPPES